MSFLRPDSFRLTIVNQDIPEGCDREERWYGTKHRVEKLPSDFLGGIAAAFKGEERPERLGLPHKNEYIPNQLDVEKSEVEHPAKIPKLIRNQDEVRVWWKKDDQFLLPKANVQVCLRTPISNLTPRANVMTRLWSDFVKDALAVALFDACIAGLNYDFITHTSGALITVTGYNHKLPLLFEKIMTSLRNTEIQQDRFEIIHERVLRTLRNQDYLEPFHQVATFSRVFKSQRCWKPGDLFEELNRVTAEDLQYFHRRILSQSHIEVLAHGNVQKKEALDIADFAERTLRPENSRTHHNPTSCHLVWPAGCNYVYAKELEDPENVNHCIEYSLYIGDCHDEDTRAKLLLIGQMVEEPCFDQLRTKEKLGYIVVSGPSFEHNWGGYSILIQSERNCAFLEGRIVNFLNLCENIIKEMSEEEYKGHRRAVINKCLVKLENLWQENRRFLNHIVSDRYDFTQADTVAKQLGMLTKNDMADFYAQYIAPSSAQRSKLSVHLHAQSKTHEPALDREKSCAVAANQIELAKLAMDDTNPSLPAEPEVLSEFSNVRDSSQSVSITDIAAFKASMRLSTGVKPVRPFEEFVEDSEIY